MENTAQNLKIRFSLGSKLVLSIVALIIIVITFLNVATIVLYATDKRAYTYQMQATEAQLAGQEFLSLTQPAIETLRQLLGSFNPSSPPPAPVLQRLQNLLDNQSVVETLSIFHTSADAQSITKELFSIHKTGSNIELPNISDAQLASSHEDLLSSHFAYANLSELGHPPAFAVLLSDPEIKIQNSGLVVAQAGIDLSRFGQNSRSNELSILNLRGDILFSSQPEALFIDKIIPNSRLFQEGVSSILRTGALEYTFDDQRLLGSFHKPGLGLLVLTNTSWRRAMSATFTLAERFILLGLIAIGVAILFSVIFSKSLVAPLTRLTAATEKVAGGDFELQLPVKSRDEIGVLSSSFNVMSEKIQSLIQESVEKTRLEGELAIASTVQQTLIPPEEYSDPRISIVSHYESAAECGGDWWGFFGVGNRVSLMIADATGHGLPSALITAAARSCYSVMQKLAQEDPEFTFSPGAMLSYANRVVYDAAHGQIMMTFFNGVIDFDQQTLTYASAGHNPPWLFSQKSDGTFKQQSLVAKGMRLGEKKEVPDYKERTISFSKNDILFLYTDGIIEGTNLAGEQFGKKRVKSLLESHLSAGTTAMRDHLISEFKEHNADKAYDDDVTLAITTLLPTPGGQA